MADHSDLNLHKGVPAEADALLEKIVQLQESNKRLRQTLRKEKRLSEKGKGAASSTAEYIAADLARTVDQLQREVSEHTSTTKELAHAEAELRAEREQLRQAINLIDQSHDAVIVNDAEGKIVFWNKGAERTFGYRRSEALAKTSHELLDTEFPQPLVKITADLIRDGHWDGELVHKRSDGEPVTVESRWVIRYDEENQPAAILEIDRDITEQKRTRRQMQQTANLLTTMFNAIHVCVAYLDTDFNFIRVNAAYAAADGKKPEFFPGKNHFDLYPDEENRAIFQKVVDTGRPVTYHEKPFEYPAAPGRGTTYWDWNLQPVKDVNGKVTGVVLSLLNVTERVRARDKIQAERNRIYTLLNILPGHVIMIDPEQYRIVYANHAFLEAFSAADTGPCYKIQYDRNTPCEHCRLREVVETGRDQQWQDTYANGRTYRRWAYPFTEADGRTLMLELGIDITEQRRLERLVNTAGDTERRRLGRDLHDTLGQTLTGMKFMLENLSRKHVQEFPEDAATIEQITGTIGRCIEQVRGIARGLDPVGLEADGLSSALGELARYTERTFGISCRLEVDEDTAAPHWAVTNIYRIAQEALNNAAKHAEAKNITIAFTDTDENVILKISDDGKGISTRTEQSEGMGLRIMKYRADAAGGSLAVESEPDNGTSVICRIPKKDRLHQGNYESQEKETEAAGKGQDTSG